MRPVDHHDPVRDYAPSLLPRTFRRWWDSALTGRGARGLPGAFAVFLLGASLGCGGDDSTNKQPYQERHPEVRLDPAKLTEARATADALASGLMGELVRVLESGDTKAALAYCADSAQAFTARHQTERLSVRRVGTRLRNSHNSPNSIEESILSAFQSQLDSGTAPRDTAFVATGPRGQQELRYLRPILVAAPCLACHGDKQSMEPDLRALLADRYPEDQATGYASGELRGAISVRLRDEPPAK